MKLFWLLCQILWFACSQDSVQQPKVLYRQKTPEIEEVATPLATLKFQGSVTHMHVIDQRICHNVKLCLLQDFILVGEASGRTTFLTPQGNFLFQIPPPDICTDKPVLKITVTSYRKRIGAYDYLLFVSFDRCGVYAIKLDSSAMRASTSWTPICNETGRQTVKELQVLSTRRANGCLGHAILLLLDDMTLWSGLISIDISGNDGDLNSCETGENRFNKVDEGIVSFKTSRSSLYGLRATGEVFHAPISHAGEVLGVSIRCDGRWRHERQLLIGIFDLSRRKTWFSAVLDDGTIQSIRVGKICEVVSRIKISNADLSPTIQPLKLSATNGYSLLVSNKFLGLYNQTQSAGYDLPPVFIQKVDALIKDKIPYSFSFWLQHTIGKRLFSIQKANLHALLHKASNDRGIFLVSFANFICIYRPNFFEPEAIHRSKKILQILGGLLKSVALVIAAALGISWSKLASKKSGQARSSQEFDRLLRLSEDFRSNYGVSSQAKTLLKRRTRPGDELKVAMLPQADVNSNQHEAFLKQEKFDLAP